MVALRKSENRGHGARSANRNRRSMLCAYIILPPRSQPIATRSQLYSRGRTRAGPGGSTGSEVLSSGTTPQGTHQHQGDPRSRRWRWHSCWVFYGRFSTAPLGRVVAATGTATADSAPGRSFSSTSLLITTSDQRRPTTTRGQSSCPVLPSPAFFSVFPVSLPLSHESKNQPQESNCRWTGIVQVIPNDSKGWGKPQGRGVEEPIVGQVDRF